jgi:hypothetical protein
VKEDYLMPTAITKFAEGALEPDIAPADLKRLRQLMRRDRVSWTEFLHRAIQAYDLMYSRDG